jgi:hypothetical protein
MSEQKLTGTALAAGRELTGDHSLPYNISAEDVEAAKLLKRLNDADGLPTDQATLQIAQTDLSQMEQERRQLANGQPKAADLNAEIAEVLRQARQQSESVTVTMNGNKVDLVLDPTSSRSMRLKQFLISPAGELVEVQPPPEPDEQASPTPE